MFLGPQLAYPIGCTIIEAKDLRQIFGPVLNVILHTMGLNHNFPLSVLHTSIDNLGLAIDGIIFAQGIAQLQLLLGHLKKSDRTRSIIEIDRDHIEMTIWVGR